MWRMAAHDRVEFGELKESAASGAAVGAMVLGGPEHSNGSRVRRSSLLVSVDACRKLN